MYYIIFLICSIFIAYRRNEAASRPKSEHIPKRVASFKRSPSPYDDSDSGSYNFNSAPAYATSKYWLFVY